MRRIISLTAVTGIFSAVLIVHAIAADQKSGVVNQPKVATPPAQNAPTAPTPPKTTGFVIQGNQLQALPGYVLQSGPNNQVIVRMSQNGGLGDVAASCSCRKGTGTCTVVTTTHGSTCDKGEKGTCTGSCEYMPGTGTGLTGARMQ